MILGMSSQAFLTNYIAVTTILSFGLILLIDRTIKFNNLGAIMKVLGKKDKGHVLIKLFIKDGTTKYMAGKLNSDGTNIEAKLGKNENVTFLFKPETIYRSFRNIPTVDYFQGNQNPRSRFDSSTIPTSPTTYNNILANAIKAESSSAATDWVKENWWKIALAIGAVIAVLLFMLMNYQNANIQLAQELARTNVVVVE